MGVRIVRSNMVAGPSMQSLTACQANRTTVGMKTVRRSIARPDMQSLTDCHANRSTVGVKTVRRDTM